MTQPAGDVFDAVRAEFDAPADFPPDVIAEAQAVGGEAAPPFRNEAAMPYLTVDRFGLVVRESICGDRPVPDWEPQGLPVMPEIMTSSDRLADSVAQECTDGITAATMWHRVGEVLGVSIVDVTTNRAPVQISNPPILAQVVGEGFGRRRGHGQLPRGRCCQAKRAVPGGWGMRQH